MLKYLQALQALLVLMLILAFVHIARMAYADPARFAQNVSKSVAKGALQYNQIQTEIVFRALDQTVGRIPVVGPVASNVTKAGLFLPIMPVTKGWDVAANLVGGDVGGAWGAIASTPADVWKLVKVW